MILGRQSELPQLVRLLTDGIPVAVVGEPGVGKTSLLRAAIAASGRGSLEGGALATLSWLPYLSLARALGIESFAGGDAAYVADQVERAVGDRVLMLDDLHWADGETRRVLPLLAGRIAIAACVRTGDRSTAEVLAETDALGFHQLRIEPLEPGDAAALARRLRDDLPAALVDEIVRASGGNPLLVEELAIHGGPTASLRLALAARVRGLSDRGREGMGLLALAGRPLDRELIGEAAEEELLGAGFAVRRDDTLEVRHALLAEAATDMLDPGERRHLHSLLGSRILAPGEAARHHAAAGQFREAIEKALAAAEQAAVVGERASHLEVAAECAEGPAAALMRLEAARALAAAGRYEAVDRVLAAVESDDALMQAEVALLRARGAAQRDDLPVARALLEDAAVLAAGSDTPLEHRVAVDRLELDLGTLDRDSDDVQRAAELVSVAQSRGWNESFAHSAYARARSRSELGGWEAAFARAIEAAAAAGEVELECRTTELLGTTLVKLGRPGAAQAFKRGRRRAEELHLLAWERRFATRALWTDFHGGRFSDVFEGAHALLAQPVDAWERYLLLYLSAQAAADLGRFELGHTLVDELDRLATGNQRQRQALWARADLELWAGRPRAAVEAAERAFALFPGETSTFIRVTHAWALHELGIDPGAPAIDPPEPFLAGARPELVALWHAHGGRWEDAADAYGRAEAGWLGQHARGELRCAWARGDALRAAGRTAEAVEALVDAERRAEAHGHAPLAGRIRRSLRAAGVGRSSARGSLRGGLTPREHEVLTLVGEGLTNDVIASRLGITRRTVETMIVSACRKLGARSRLQAAALAATAGSPGGEERSVGTLPRPAGGVAGQ